MLGICTEVIKNRPFFSFLIDRKYLSIVRVLHSFKYALYCYQ